MSYGGSASKGTSDTSTSHDNHSNGTTIDNPNNLAAMQTGWNSAGDLLANSDWQNTLTQGTKSLTGAAPTAEALGNTAAGTATDFANGNYSTNGANQYLTPFANGSKVNTTNPDFQNVIDQFSRTAQAATDGNFAASGRYGSGANANAFNGAVANQAGQLGYQNYMQQQQNQLTAAQLLGQNNTAGTGQQLTAAGMSPNLVSSLFTPGTDLSAAGYAPLAAYIASITAGNAGGRQDTNANAWGQGKQNTMTTNLSASAGGGGFGGSAGA